MITIPLALPLIPLIAWAATAAAGIFAVKKVFFTADEINEVKEDVHKSRKIAILGLHQAGKTTLLRFLQGEKNYRDKTVGSGVDEYEEFQLKIGDKSISISKNIDIGGSVNFVRNYQSILKDSDMAFFLFDVSLFFNNNEYYRDFCARVHYLQDMTNSTYFIATHPDKTELTDNLKVKISEKLKSKDYQGYVNQRLFVINLLDDKKLTEFVTKVFS